MESIVDHIGADGTFTDGFAGAVTAELGEGYEDTKYPGEFQTLTALTKAGIDSRRANTKLTEAAKNSIARPGEGASDEDRAAFKTTLRSELGATGKLDDYKVAKPENLPAGLPWNEEGAKGLAQFCCEQGIPVGVYETMRDAAVSNGVAAFNASEETAEKDANTAFDTAVKALTDTKTGPELIEMGTLARKAIEGYNLPGKDKEHAQAVMAATSAAPADLKVWREQGVSPTSFAYLAAIGKDMVAGTTKRGDGSAGGDGDGQKNFVDHCSSQSPSLQN
ncbi:MAG: hypothetical protein V3W44_04305 [Dehalococcoidales bacterium]